MTIELEDGRPPEWMIALENKQKRVSFKSDLHSSKYKCHSNFARLNETLMVLATQISSRYWCWCTVFKLQ